MARLLLVEDDDTIGQALHTSLTSHDHDVVWTTSGREALDLTGRRDVDLVLLDLGLPDLDGVAVCRRLRAARPDCVIVILTARDDEMDVVIGLEAGADDYLTKPLGLAELHARVRAHLRRAEAAAPAGGATRAVIGDLVLDPGRRQVTIGGREIHLRIKEYELLARLAAEPGVAVSRESLMSDVWDEHWFGSTKTLDVHIASLRRRLLDGAAGSRVPQIVTLRGHGYRLDEPDADSCGPGPSASR